MKQQMILRSLLVITIILQGFNLRAQVVTIHVETPGTLSSHIASNKKNQITSLTLTGDLNGTDILYIREMASKDVNNETTSGKLSVLDISDANIVTGGAYYNFYDGSYYYKDNEIGEYMFSNCTQLTTITIPNSIIYIYGNAFFGCTRLSNILVPQTNKYFYSNDGVLFSKDKSGLISYPNSKSSSYTIPNSVTWIGRNAFSGCIGLTSVTISNSVTSIGSNAFSGCTGLTSATIPNSVTWIGDGGFSDCNGLIAITISNNITSISDNTFIGCSGLTSVTISSNITSIGRFAFSGCTGLTSVFIPKSVTSIGYLAFQSCSRLKEIHINNAIPLTIESSVFNGIEKNTCKLYVPKGSYSSYWLAPVWGDFANIIEESVSGKFSINVSGNDKGKIYLNETQVNNAAILVDANSAATFRFVPETGCSLTKVTQDGVDITSSIVNGSYTISSVNKDLFVIATFTEDPVYLTTKDAVSGQFKLVVKKGNQYTYKIEAESGWSINTVTFNGVDVTTQLDASKQYTTPAITGNCVLNVSYQNSGTAVSQTLANRLKVYTEGDVIVIEGAEEGLQIAICTESGALIQNFKAANDIIRVTVPQNAVYLIQAGGQTLKVAL